VLTCFSAFIALLGKSGTLTMVLLIIAYLALRALPILFPVTDQLLFTRYFSIYTLFVGYVPQLGRLMNMLLIVLSTGAVFFIGGSIVFDKKSY
jgi:hypothetical protein